MEELSLGTIFDNTPQAKGRVEMANYTLQDGLVKEMRLRNISTMQAGNLYLPEFRKQFNNKFAVVPKSTINMHRKLTQQENLDDNLVQKHQRILSKSLSFSYENKLYQITTNRPSYALKHARVTIIENTTGTIKVVYNKEELAFEIITIQPKIETVDTKQLNTHVDQLIQRVWLPQPATHPWKQPYLHW